MDVTTKAKVLFIDDEESICIAISNLLKLYKHSVEYVLTAEEGIAYLKQNPETDIVLLDINLGTGLSGIEALPLLKKVSKYIQIVMLTSEEVVGTAIECLKNGAFYYMTKPFDEEEFNKQVPLILENKRIIELNDLYLNLIVHDLNDPLNYIKLALDSLKDSFNSPQSEKNKLLLGAFDFGIKQIEIMISNILYINEMEIGKIEEYYQEINLQEEVKKELRLFLDKILLHDKNIKLQFSSSNLILKTNTTFFFQILWNLVSNAFRFSSAQSTIEICFIEEENNILHITVCDHGSFIDDKNKEFIFSKYSQAYNNKYLSNQNFGLGLTFSKLAVDYLGGDIWLESDKNTLRTIFHFTVKNKKAA
jgi:K+-sensing histidine kinase KdpD